MADQPYHILLVEPDADLLEMLVASLARRFDAQIRCVSDAESCLDAELAGPHDLVIAELALRDAHGLDLVSRLTAISHRPVILLANDPTCDEVIEAMRLGVRDVLRHPFPIDDLLDAVNRLLHGQGIRRQRAARYRRMRELVRRTVRERRDLQQRIELVCRDLVGAHRRLVHRVLDAEGRKSSPST